MRVRVHSATTLLPLFDATATRAIECQAAQLLPPHTLMQRAGQSVADMARAVAPHARSVWIACGPGNNGGDGLVAASLLLPWTQAKGGSLTVTLHAHPDRLPDDARWALEQAVAAGVTLSDAPPDRCDLVIDALLGLSNQARTPSSGDPHGLQQALTQIRQAGPILLCVDTPSDLDPFRGTKTVATNQANKSDQAVFCLTLLTLKPGLFTGHGRDLAGDVWWDDLGVQVPSAPSAVGAAPSAWWMSPAAAPRSPPALHASHKGTGGDVWVLGGQRSPAGSMVGATLLAARAALHAGAGRVHVTPLDPDNTLNLDPIQPELMFRPLDIAQTASKGLPTGTWVVGCGGGELVSPWLPIVLSCPHTLVLDADALNQLSRQPALQAMVSARSARGYVTVITPHPLEAARLLNTTTSEVQSNRLGAAQALADRWGCVCVLKGSGTVVAAPGWPPVINGSGNGQLATAGTGDVLAGLLGAQLARQRDEFQTAPPSVPWSPTMAAALQAVSLHGAVADHWPLGPRLTASALAQNLRV